MSFYSASYYIYNNVRFVITLDVITLFVITTRYKICLVFEFIL